MGGQGHYFMENPQGLGGGTAPKIAVCSKIGYLARAVLYTDAPHPASHPQSSACFYKAGVPAAVPGGAPQQQGQFPP